MDPPGTRSLSKGSRWLCRTYWVVARIIVRMAE